MRKSAATLLLFLAACKRNAPPSSAPVEDELRDETTPLARGDADAAPGVAAARCVATGEGEMLVEGGVELGDAIALGPGTALAGTFAVGAFALGLVRSGPKGRIATVALVTGGKVTRVDLGRPLGDAPPPRVVATADGVLAATLVRAGDAGGGFALEIMQLVGDRATPRGRLPQPSDESLAFDVAAAPGGVIVAWDDDAADRAHGVIKVARVGAEAGAPASISSPGSDAEAPRLVRRPGGYFAAWLARRPEAPRAGAAEPEGPAEERASRWIEAIALDLDGHPIGAPRAVTAPGGHVAAFDLAARGDAIEVWAVDETERTEGAGGRLLRASGEAPAVVVAERGVGRAGVDVVALPSGEPRMAVFVDGAERARAVWPEGGVPSAEPAFDGTRPLVAVADGAALQVTAALVTPAGVRLRTARCAGGPR